MLAKLRAVMSSLDKDTLSGTVEVDEWYHGGVARGGTALTGKNLVVAAVEHALRGRGYAWVRFRIIGARGTWQLRKAVRAMVAPGARIITDGLNAYPGAMAGHTHEARNESAPGAGAPHVLLPAVTWITLTRLGGDVRRQGHGAFRPVSLSVTISFNKRATRYPVVSTF
jgi:hypothetical protein